MPAHDAYRAAAARPRPDEAQISRRSLLRVGWTPAARADIDYDGVTARVRAEAERGADTAMLRAIEPVAEVVAGLLDLKPGDRVFDAGAGDGNVVRACGARGATSLAACDLAETMVERGRARCGEQVCFRQADVQALPYADASFDAVASAFGFALAPRPRRATRELVRVCRPGGRVVLAAWVPRGLPGGLFDLIERFLPLPPGIRSPADWGRADVARERLEPLLDDLEIRTRTVPLRFASPDTMFAALAPSSLDPAQRAAARPGFDRLLASVNNRPPAAEVDGRYLLLTGRRASESWHT